MTYPKNSAKYILYVDDDIADLEDMVQGFLEHPEFTLVTFGKSKELMEFLKLQLPELDIQLIISDINMPGTNGFEMVRLLKADKLTSAIPACFYSTSGNTMDKFVADSMRVPVFAKPWHMNEMNSVIGSMLESRKGRLPLDIISSS